MVLYGAENRTLQKVDQKYLGRSEKCYWRRMEWISWTNGVKNEVLHGEKGARKTLHRINRRKDNWIGHILHRNCLLEHITEVKIEERIELIGRQERRHKQTLDTSRKQENIGN
jgi:hypothetical protein